jgi:hypothetical protein
MAACLMAGLLLDPSMSTPALSLIALVLAVLLMSAGRLDRRGRFPWLSPALASAFFAAELAQTLAQTWTRSLWSGVGRVVVVALFGALSAVYAVVAVAQARRRRGDQCLARMS